jgi:tRNA threonylcarbamoyladenosine biosynthesis protein TsaE
MKKLTSHSLEETKKIADEWLVEISSKYDKADKALLVGLSGHLGAGKTAFVRLVARTLGINEDVTSPTFVIMKIYDIDPKSGFLNWKKLVHIDAYRLERSEDLAVLNFEELLEDKNNLIMIEWPENVGLQTEDKIQMKVLENKNPEIPQVAQAQKITQAPEPPEALDVLESIGQTTTPDETETSGIFEITLI